MKGIKIKVVVQAKKENVAGWPHINFNYEKETAKIMDCVRAENPEVIFDVVKYTSVSEAERDYEADRAVYDGVLVLLMTNWLKIDLFYARKAKDGIPCAIADVPFCGSGSTLAVTSPTLRTEKLPVPLVASRDYRDIAWLVRALVVSAQIKKAVILVIKNNPDTETMAAVAQNWGCHFIVKSAEELMKLFHQVSEKEAQVFAEKWSGAALSIVEPSAGDIIESARMHIAITKLMEECEADAVTIDCLELSYFEGYENNRHMYPCLSYFQMADQGKLGVCEADIDSTLSSMLILYLTGRPGFVSDPVIDTSSDEIIYAHCVACRKVYGCHDSRTASFHIRSHAEDQKGASVQVIFPGGDKLTTINMSNKDGWACIHSATAVGNEGLDAGCRSKLVASCAAQKILENWMPMWHRVTVYGNYRKELINLFKLKGLEIIEEDK
ncbi:hypothetical protein EII17_01670 [Clostridiales bacterium COT073_COT-073]|nr:hypothetical protein EII17_01670 [Clostridiales bacterium COT073_COT-073]